MIRRVLIGGFLLFLLIQLIPYGRDHTNPPVRLEPVWDSPQTRALAVRACFDCHSNETQWLWFHNIAPISWGVQFDVMRGRERLNFSEWDEEQDKAEEAAEVVEEGEMPPARYILAHPEANLSQAERDALIQGLLATFGGDNGGSDNSGPGSGEDNEQDNDNSGPGSGEDDGDGDNSGPGSGEDRDNDGDNSGPGSGGDRDDDSDNSGPGSGDE